MLSIEKIGKMSKTKQALVAVKGVSVSMAMLLSGTLIAVGTNVWNPEPIQTTTIAAVTLSALLGSLLAAVIVRRKERKAAI